MRRQEYKRICQVYDNTLKEQEHQIDRLVATIEKIAKHLKQSQIKIEQEYKSAVYGSEKREKLLDRLNFINGIRQTIKTNLAKPEI